MMKLWNRALWIFTLLLLLPIMLSGCEKDVSDREDETSHRHEWSDWTIEKEPTCAENGKKVRTCECGEESVRRLDALGHTYTDGICETCGERKPSEGLEFRSNGDGTCSVKGMGTCRDTLLVIPSQSPDGERVTGIVGYAFEEERLLEKVVIPDGVASIGKYAFAYCYSLVDVSIPKSLTTIDNSAFYDCDVLKSICVPEGVVSIGNYAFASCNSLTSVTLPETCTTIEQSAFAYCDNITEISFPSALTLVDERMFYDCASLKNVRIPRSVTDIGEDVFVYCYSLSDITYAGTMAEWQSIDKGLGWNSLCSTFTVHCTDGDIPKSEA